MKTTGRALLAGLVALVGTLRAQDAQANEEVAALVQRVNRIDQRYDLIQAYIELARQEEARRTPMSTAERARLREAIENAPESAQILYQYAISQNEALRQEASIKFDWLRDAQLEVKLLLNRASAAPNPAEAAVLRKEARRMAGVAERLTNLFLGARPVSPGATDQPPAGGRPGPAPGPDGR
ncbi:MAG: hypothetical protein ACYTED_18415, partial [Planctomycetota bacterium]